MATEISKRRSSHSRVLACIPSAKSVQERLDAVMAEARQLRILLKTAKEIENSGSSSGEGKNP